MKTHCTGIKAASARSPIPLDDAQAPAAGIGCGLRSQLSTGWSRWRTVAVRVSMVYRGDGADGGDKFGRALMCETAQHDSARAQGNAGGAPRDASSASEKASGGIMENHADGVPLARVKLADAVVQLHLIVAPHSLHRTAVDRE